MGCLSAPYPSTVLNSRGCEELCPFAGGESKSCRPGLAAPAPPVSPQPGMLWVKAGGAPAWPEGIRGKGSSSWARFGQDGPALAGVRGCFQLSPIFLSACRLRSFWPHMDFSYNQMLGTLLCVVTDCPLLVSLHHCFQCYLSEEPSS